MAFTVTNLIQGPGTLYRGAFGVTEPTGVATPSTGWTDVGGTQGGVKLTITQEYAELDVDQVIDVPARVRTKRDFMVETNCAEVTLENLAFTLNETAPAAAAAGVQTFNPSIGVTSTQPSYSALAFVGIAPGGFKRLFIGRRMLSIANTEIAYSKGDQTVLTASFNGHWVSPSITPFKVVDENASV